MYEVLGRKVELRLRGRERRRKQWERKWDRDERETGGKNGKSKAK
jgi:hypothetical protein